MAGRRRREVPYFTFDIGTSVLRMNAALLVLQLDWRYPGIEALAVPAKCK